VWLAKGATMLHTSRKRKECNKYDLMSVFSVSDWPLHNDWSRWFAISSSPPISCFSSVGGVAKKIKKLNLDVKNIFSGSHTEHSWRLSKLRATFYFGVLCQGEILLFLNVLTFP
jgi:hypothetical protein